MSLLLPTIFFLNATFIFGGDRVNYIVNNVLLSLFFGGFGFYYARNSIKNIRLCNSYIIEMVLGEPNIMKDSLVMKRDMFK